MNKIRKNVRKFKDSDEGVAGIVVAVLLTGLLISSIAIIQLVHVPKWMEQKEAEHMSNVANQFAQLKFAIDTLSVAAQPNCPISTPVTLGSEEMPFLTSMRAYGSLYILPYACRITINNSVSSVSHLAGSVKYSSSNAYYLDQSYIYENGAVILSQAGGDVMPIRPAFLVIDRDDLSFNIIKIAELGGKTAAGGYGTYPIQTKFLSSDTSNITNVETIEIETSYKNAWNVSLNSILSNSNINFEITDDDDRIIITFDAASTPDLYLRVIEIGAQISPGWVG